jgi:hypothetical protein
LIPLVPVLLELGELLPEVDPLGPQSFIAVCDPVLPLELAPGLLELEPVVEPLVVPLELVEPDGLFIAEELPGPQSVRLLFIAPLFPVLVLGLVLVEPPVLPVCASAAVPSDRARIDAAVRTRRFIRCPPCTSEASPGTLPGKPPAAAARSGLAAESRNARPRATHAIPERKRAAPKCGPSSGRKSPKDLQCAPEDRPRTAGKE